MLQNLGDLEFDLSRSLKVKSNGAVGLSIYDFLLVSNSNYMSKSRRLGVKAIQNFFSYLLSLGSNFDPPHPPLPHGDFFQNRMVSSLAWVRGKASTKNEVDIFNIGSIFF